MVNMNGLTARRVEVLGVPRKGPEHGLPKYLDLHQTPRILIDRRPSTGEKGKTYDHAAIKTTYMVDTPASMAAANVSSAAKALFQRCSH
jgi:hypothetical protein